MRYAARDYNHSGSVSGTDVFLMAKFHQVARLFSVASHATTKVSEADYTVLDVNNLFSFQKTLQAALDGRGSR